MPTIRYFDRHITSAIVLGVAALLTNTLSFLLLDDHSIPAGNIFLFCSAAALGATGALVSTAIGVVPQVLFSSEYVAGLRLIALCCVISAVTGRYPRVPMFAVTLTLWALCFAPLQYFFAGTAHLVDTGPMTFTALSEILFAMIAGALLLNTEIWGAITHRPRHVALSSLLIHFFTIASTVSMLGAFTLRVRNGWSIDGATFESNLRTIVSLIALCVALPSFLGWRLARRLSSNSQELLDLQVLSRGQAKTFSGLASDFWRRREDNSVPRSTLPDASFTGSGSSSGQLSVPIHAQNSAMRPDQGICALNRDGTITFMNRRFKAYAGLGGTEVLGKRINTIGLNPALSKHIIDLIEATFTRGPKVTELKLNQLPDKLRYFEIATLKPQELEHSSLDGGPDSIIVTLKDITERRTVESHLLQSQKLSSLGNLLTNIVHSFNNTLTAIVGLASYARVAKDPVKVSTSLEKILASAQAAGHLVRNLLDFTAGGPSHVKNEDFERLVQGRIDVLKKIVGENYEIVFTSSVHDIGVECDVNLIMQTITNLVVNSRDAYQGKSGVIEISLDQEEIDEDVSRLHPGARPGKFARLRVKDQGVGMNAEVLSRACDPLFTTKSGGHTGLGLSTVHAIVRAHDGFLTIESQAGKGTSVSIYLPIKELDSAKESSSSLPDATCESDMPHASNNGHQERILVVEDETSVRELVGSMLAHLGYDVTMCCSGQEALLEFERKNFDLVLVDMIMPRMHGLDLISRIRTAKQNTKALIMTGYGVTAENKADQSFDVIPKPFDLGTLAHAVRHALHPKPASPVSAATRAHPRA